MMWCSTHHSCHSSTLHGKKTKMTRHLRKKYTCLVKKKCIFFFYQRRRKPGYLQTDVKTVVWIIFDLQRELPKQRIGFSHTHVFSLTNFRPITGRHTPFYLLFINIVFPDNTAGELAQLLPQWYVSSAQMLMLLPSGCIHSKSDAATKQAGLYSNIPDTYLIYLTKPTEGNFCCIFYCCSVRFGVNAAKHLLLKLTFVVCMALNPNNWFGNRKQL